jgi:hypothetical protein
MKEAPCPNAPNTPPGSRRGRTSAPTSKGPRRPVRHRAGRPGRDVRRPAHERVGTLPTAVYIEKGKTKVFACAYDWPGWCRSAKTEKEALEALAAYAPRYAVIAEQAGVRFPATAGSSLEVVNRLTGDGSTDYGIPGKPAPRDKEAVTAAQAKRLVAFVEAAWAVLDKVAKGAPATLKKGPRGGGRDRDPIVEHVREAEGAYASKLGIKPSQVDDLRAAIVEVLGKPSDGKPLRPKGWSQRYAVRRIAWHAIDHAWEIEDKSA